MLDRKTKADFNEKRYSDSVLGFLDSERIKSIVELVGSGKDVLDLGCGSGEIDRVLIQNGNTVNGLDISETCVRKAKEVGVAAVLCDVENEDIPFKNKFDVALTAEIIEHIMDTNAFLKKTASALKPEGELVLTTPNLAALGRRLLLLANKNPHMEVSLEQVSAGHVRYFIKDTLEQLLLQNGFKIVNFTSDVVNFNASGSLRSVWLAKMFPTLGRSLIIKCVKR